MKNRNIIIAAMVVFSLFLIYIILYRPLIKKLKMKSAEYAAIENKINSAQRLINSSKAMKSDIVMITEKEVSLAIDELTKHGKSLGVEFRAIKPREIIKSDPVNQYKMLPVDIEIEASDKQLADFLGSLDELKKSLIKIYSLDIKADDMNKAMLKAKVVIGIYFSSESGA
ncbi:MAG: type 4a pilus biogenesis protein PilO [Candidatus Omnitrophota bacterium]